MTFTDFRLRSLLVFSSLLSLALAASSSPYPELNDARVTEIANMLPSDPAGFGLPCSNREAWVPLAGSFQTSVTEAETFLATPLPPWVDEAYLRYSHDGNRGDGETMLEKHTGQLGPLVLAECSEWKGRFLPRIAEQLDAISSDRSWTLPAHDPKLENFNGKRYYVDLRAAVLGHDVAEALYLLGDKVPPATRRKAIAALELHVFAPMRGAFAGRPDSATYISWLTAKHNWNAVCLEGVVDAALTILPNRQDRAIFAAAAEHWSGNYLDSFTDTGYDTEGLGYWDYGFSHYDELREQLWLSTSGKLDLFDNPKARRAALFGFQFAMLAGVYADFGDAHFMVRPAPALLGQLDRTFRLKMYPDDLSLMRSAKPQSLAVAVLAGFPNQSERNDDGENPKDLIGLRTWYSEPGILVDRPAQASGLAITIKDAGNGNHSHNDVGSYSIALGNTQILGDPGGPSYYNAAVFSSKRYDSRLLNSFGHPVPVIDGRLQKDATTVQPKIVSTSFSPDEDIIEMDLTAAYDVPNLRRFLRTMRYSRKENRIEMIDEFEIAQPMDIEEAFPTHGTFHQVNSNTLQFDDQGQSLQTQVSSPVPFTITQDNINDYGNPFLRAGAHLHLTQSGKVVMTFHTSSTGSAINVNEQAPAAGDVSENPGPLATDLSGSMTPHDVSAAVRKVADWEYNRVKDFPSRDWTFAPLYEGFLAASSTFHQPKYQELVLQVGDHFHWTLGTGAPRTDANEEALGYSYLELYKQDHDAAKIAPLREQLDKARETQQPSSAEPKWWWCDGLFMAPPTWALLAETTHDDSYLQYMDTQYRITDKLLWSNQYHLYFRDRSFLNRTEANGKPLFWSRGNGWVFAGLAMVLDALPENDPRRPFYLERYHAMAAEVISIQGEDGLWRTGLLDPESYEHPEVSGSAFFLYGLAWGVRHHLLDSTLYRPSIQRAWSGLTENIYADGRLGNIQPVGDSPGKYKPGASFVYGVGAFLLAGSEVEKLAETKSR